MSERLGVVVPLFNEPGIATTLEGLYLQHRTSEVFHYIVDNGSTDNTRELIHKFSKEHEEFPLIVVEEEQKGTGAAADTGFRSAIDHGCMVVARTDGDSVPTSDWSNRITDNFESRSELQLLGGVSTALRDRYYRFGDDFITRAGVYGSRNLFAILHHDLSYRRIAVGHNMATRALAYETVGGFERTSIEFLDEDIDYSEKVAKEFGRLALRVDPRLRVATSSRRLRAYGVAGTIRHFSSKSSRFDENKVIDIR